MGLIDRYGRNVQECGTWEETRQSPQSCCLIVGGDLKQNALFTFQKEIERSTHYMHFGMPIYSPRFSVHQTLCQFSLTTIF